MQTNILISNNIFILLSSIAVPIVANHLTKNIIEHGFEKIESLLEFGNEDKYFNTSQLLSKYGYPVKEYSVVTEDGYILNLVRIPRPGPVVLLFHGLFSSSDDFVTSGPHKALPYLLANSSYDVWLGNARGNKYSRRHVRLSPHDRQFWDFSWHEIGYYDLPAMIDFALTTRSQSQLVYIGHSQGTTSFFVLCSERPEYNEKFLIAFSLAPAAYTWRSTIQKMAPLEHLEYNVAHDVGQYEFLHYDKFKFLTAGLCDLSEAAQLSCITALFTISGFDYPQLDYDQVSVQLAHTPSGASVRQLTHYIQNSKRFAQFDYGARRNLAVYGQPHPPRYPVEKITAPISIFYGLNDYVCNFEDIKILIRQLPSVVDVYQVPYSLFNHIDFIWAKDVKELVYLRILKIINISVQNLVFTKYS